MERRWGSGNWRTYMSNGSKQIPKLTTTVPNNCIICIMPPKTASVVIWNPFHYCIRINCLTRVLIQTPALCVSLWGKHAEGLVNESLPQHKQHIHNSVKHLPSYLTYPLHNTALILHLQNFHFFLWCQHKKG